MNLKYKILIFILTNAILIAFPFFYIKYFESESIINLLLHNLIFISLSSLTISSILYFKIFKKFNPQTNSELKKKLQDILSIIILTLSLSLIIYGLLFSLIVIGNAFIGEPKNILIKEKVSKYEIYITKYGRFRHYIYFKNPVNNKDLRIEVYKKYKTGETFEKEMKIGKFGYLFSVD